MMNGMLISFGDGMMTGRIDWPIDGATLAIALLVVFALLLMGLLRESKPAVVTRTRSLGGALPRPLQQQQAA
jgi:hypothetical protein